MVQQSAKNLSIIIIMHYNFIASQAYCLTMNGRPVYKEGNSHSIFWKHVELTYNAQKLQHFSLITTLICIGKHIHNGTE